MKRIGIITIPDYNNYGNRLQNYASKTYFEELGYEVNTLELNDNCFDQYNARKYKLLLKKFHITLAVYIFEALSGGFAKAARERCFENFTRKYLKVKFFPSYNHKTIDYLNKTFDFFSLGSDQIWNPNVNKTPNLYFAKFTTQDKKIYFAPSFGVSTIHGEYAEMVKENLINAKNISVRENEGASIIKELTGNDAEVLMDPTFMLTAKKWASIEKKPNDLPKKKYICCYFLGSISVKYKNTIELLKRKYNCDIYYLADKDTKTGYKTGPSEFLYSINHAEMILTDSFHATVFSIIFHKKFNVFSRLNSDLKNEGLDSRVDTLLGKLKLESHKYKNNSILCEDSMFEYADMLIEDEKNKTNLFLKRSLRTN